MPNIKLLEEPDERDRTAIQEILMESGAPAGITVYSAEKFPGEWLLTNPEGEDLALLNWDSVPVQMVFLVPLRKWAVNFASKIKEYHGTSEDTIIYLR